MAFHNNGGAMMHAYITLHTKNYSTMILTWLHAMYKMAADSLCWKESIKACSCMVATDESFVQLRPLYQTARVCR